jgi:pilus assembly protein CpaE
MKATRWREVWSRDGGQASVELVALAPVVLIVGVAILTLLAARGASGQAAAAAQAGAMALIQDTDPRDAARDALPAEARRRATIRLAGRAVTVTVRPQTRIGFFGDMLAATASANAGPEPR